MSKTINQRVAMYRKLLGYSQSQIAEMLGKKSSTYSQCERTGTFTCETIMSLAEIFDADVRVLLYGEIPDAILPPHHRQSQNIQLLIPKLTVFIRL